MTSPARKPSKPPTVASKASQAATPAGLETDQEKRGPNPDPPYRSLRAFSIDPSLAIDYETAPISEVTVRVPWEQLQPGPSDEYLEVIDVDPGSGCFYAPIDLNDPSLLAQNGLAPSEGTPQFHQQMVYAVSRLTIDNFEHALGRKTLWRPIRDPKRGPKDDSVYVPRLRIYPHALREANAYYSPDKVALLFGYFNSDDDNTGEQLPGGTVFACLSQDIIAHETTHALLDGMHRKFVNATNLDVLAFHEGFADIVALLQHFTFPEILSDQIAKTQGDLKSHQSLLGQLAGQFGRATGLRGALREAIGKWEGDKWVRQVPNPADYAATVEPHDRGAILVAAIFDAFLAIYERRTADLLRLATSGSGVLGSGAIHPDLVARLAGEATKAARHVLTMCIRALDYCPPVDITFGEYLRAIITADYDLVDDDRLKYRVAFIEAFRRRGIYPPDVRSMSVDSLVWRSDSGDLSEVLWTVLGALKNEVSLYLLTPSRKDSRSAARSVSERRFLFALQRQLRAKLHALLQGRFVAGGRKAAEYLMINPEQSFEVNIARLALRSRPDGGVIPQLLFTVLQRTEVPLDPDDPDGPKMSFEGGSSVVADLRNQEIKYRVYKSPQSKSRLAQQQGFSMAQITTARSTYVNTSAENGEREPFALLHRGL